jgi:LysM repeat protein
MAQMTSIPRTTKIAGKTYTSNQYTPMPAKVTPVAKNKTTIPAINQTASAYSAMSGLSGLLSSLSKMLKGSSGGGMNFPVGEGINSVEQQSQANTAIAKYTGSNTNYTSKPIQGPVRQPINSIGIASKQSQPVLNNQGQAITGGYSKSSAGGYSPVPMQSLGYNATGLTPEKINNTKAITDKFNLQLNQTKNTAWDSFGTKNDKIANLMQSTAGEFGKNFSSPDELDTAYNFNPTVKSALDNFISSGGTLEQIKSKILSNQATQQPYTIQQGDTLNAISSRTGKTVQELMALNPQITNPNLIQAGSALNLGNVQNTTTYLDELQKPYVTDPNDLLKMPQDEMIKNEMLRQMNIPKEWEDYYLGTPNKMGIFEREKAAKQAELDLIQEKLSDDKRTYREKANLNIDKTRSELAVNLAETETNRLKAKNYMTGLLAKLGALNTTGAAGEALVKLDQKYEEMKQNTTNKYNLAIRGMEIEMNEGLNDIENGYESKAQAIREDLSKSATDINKELMKLKQESQSKLYSLSSSYASLVEKQKAKAIEANKKNSNDYVTEFRSVIGPTLPGQTLGGRYVTVPKANSSPVNKTTTSKTTNTSGISNPFRK